MNLSMSIQMHNCKVCGQKLFNGPLLKFTNLPQVAQYLPDQETVREDLGADLEIFQCSGCGLIQLSHEPVPYYKEVIRAAGFSPEMEQFRREQFSDFVSRYSLQSKKIIEVGCGRGEYLSIMSGCGVDAHGVEYNDDAVNQCIKNNLKASKHFIDNEVIKIADGPFDAFFILSFLEHLPEPNKILRGIYNNLTDDGVGIVEVPNFDMILRNKLFSEFMRDHLFYFTRESLNFILSMNGFEMIDCKEVWHDYIISAVVKKRKKTDLAAFNDYQKKIQTEVNKFIDLCKNKQVAIWGAGHQAFAIMSICGLSGKIKYVIDSAPFKQGKFTPATHIPIVPSETLNNDPVEAVIIMAGSYSDEISKIVREKYSKINKVAILRDFGLEMI